MNRKFVMLGILCMFIASLVVILSPEPYTWHVRVIAAALITCSTISIFLALYVA